MLTQSPQRSQRTAGSIFARFGEGPRRLIPYSLWYHGKAGGVKVDRLDVETREAVSRTGHEAGEQRDAEWNGDGLARLGVKWQEMRLEPITIRANRGYSHGSPG